MKLAPLFLAVGGGLALAACSHTPPPPPAPPPMLPPGAVPGSTAADRNGDGVIDGYYTPDGVYHPLATTPPPPPPPRPSRTGERG